MAVTADEVGARPMARYPGAESVVDAPGFAAYVREVAACCDSCSDDRIAVRVGRALQRLVGGADWLPRSCCAAGDESYRRHLLYGDPAGRFTVLAVVWRPGQGTPVHGHTAWGAVGVYRGNPSVANYRLSRDGGLDLACEAMCRPGDISCVQRGTAYPHRVFNASGDIAVTIHTYGRDLVRDPAAINIPV